MLGNNMTQGGYGQGQSFDLMNFLMNDIAKRRRMAMQGGPQGQLGLSQFQGMQGNPMMGGPQGSPLGIGKFQPPQIIGTPPPESIFGYGDIRR